MHLGDSHADPGGETLTEGPGGHLDAQPVVDLGMPGCVTPPLSEGAEVIETEREPAQVEQRVEQHRPMAIGKDESIPIRPLGCGWVYLEEPTPQSHRDVGHAHRHSGVTAVRLLDCVPGAG